MKKILIIILSIFVFTNYSYSQPCNLTGGSVYIDVMQNPSMMNATVNGMSMYSYSWTDTNGVVVGTGNQIPFYLKLLQQHLQPLLFLMFGQQVLQDIYYLQLQISQAYIL